MNEETGGLTDKHKQREKVEKDKKTGFQLKVIIPVTYFVIVYFTRLKT